MKRFNVTVNGVAYDVTVEEIGGAAPAPVAAAEELPVEEPAADDCAIVAAIVAAISAHTGKAPTSFRVVSFKRRH